MSRFPERHNSALLVVDAQQGTTSGLPGVNLVIDTIADLVARARLAGTVVIWLRRVDAALRPGEADWQLADPLASEPTETQIDHEWDDAFIETGLADVLGGLGVGHVWLAGVASDTAVLQTYSGALQRGFDVTLVEDAHHGRGRGVRRLPVECCAGGRLREPAGLARPGPGRHGRPDRCGESGVRRR